MKSVEPTLMERTSHLYSQLLLLQRLFRVSGEYEGDWPGSGDEAQDLAFLAGIRTLVADLTGHARILTAVPFPLSEWRAGDGPDDDRWRALTEVERREVLSMVSAYENLLSWSEGLNSSALPSEPSQDRRTVSEHLSAERSRVGRFRQELHFLERRHVKPENGEPAAANETDPGLPISRRSSVAGRSVRQGTPAG